MLNKKTLSIFYVAWLALYLVGKTDAEESPSRQKSSPNIILINLDDADVGMLSPESMADHFPNLNRFATQGLQFKNFHVTTPLCGPSRAALFTARYAHNTGIKTNDPLSARSNGFAGGMVDYGAMGFHQNDISTWMQNAGYRTMMVGKYLHGDTVDIVPEGWDDFYSSRGASYFGTARFTNEENPGGLGYLEPLTTYRTTQEGGESIDLIDRHVKRGSEKPFFLYLAPLAPHNHTPHDPLGMVEDRYKNDWSNMQMPLTPDVQESDFSDKSTAIRELTLLPERQAKQLNPRHRDRMLSMKSVDDMFAELIKKLEEHEILDQTFIILTSDNGFSNGHHRMIGKGDGFNRSTHVPTYILGPGIHPGSATDRLIAHIDLAPTVVDLAGGEPPQGIDGKSFAAAIRNPEEFDTQPFRDAVLIENWETRTLHSGDFNTASAALRFDDSVYVEWANGSPEYYDLKSDPNQIENQYDDLPESRKIELQQALLEKRNTLTTTDTTLSHPFQMNEIHGTREPFRGMAESGSGIDSVFVTVRRLHDQKYWNGETWQWQPSRLPATVTNPGQSMTTWTCETQLANYHPDDLFEVTAVAYDVHGISDPQPAWVVFRMDHSQPTSEILAPETDKMTIDSFGIKGTTADEDAVDHVRLVIRNRGNGKYWTGTDWTNKWTSIEHPVRRSGRWNYRIPNAIGNFYVSVRAVDPSGNVQSPPVWRSFSVAMPEKE